MDNTLEIRDLSKTYYTKDKEKERITWSGTKAFGKSGYICLLLYFIFVYP